MRLFKTEGIVIKRKNVGEADKLITILTKNFGKIRLKAKGVRKISSRRSPHVEPLNLTTISFYKGNGIPILTEAYTKNSFPKIKNNLKKVGYAYYSCELIDVLCPDNQENDTSFSLLQKNLEDLSNGHDIDLLIKKFEVDLLTNLGYFNLNSNKNNEEDLSLLVEQIIEKKLKTKQILPRLI